MERFIALLSADLATFTWVLEQEGNVLDGPKEGSAQDFTLAIKARENARQTPVKTTFLGRALFSHRPHFKVIILLPTDCVSLYTVSLPIQNLQQLAQAIPFALEEKLPFSIDALHFAWVKIQNSVTPLPDKLQEEPVQEKVLYHYAVATIEQRLMQQLLDLLRAHDISLDALVPAGLLLPWRENTGTLVFSEGKVLVKTGAYQVFSIEEDKAPLFISLLLAKENLTEGLEIWGDEKSISRLALKCPSHSQKLPEGGLLPILLTGNNGFELNLLQGKYKPILTFKKIIKRFKRIFFWVGALVLFEVCLKGGMLVYSTLEIEALDSKIISLYQKTFPMDKRIVNPKVQMQSHINALQKSMAGVTLLDYLGSIALPLKTAQAMLLGMKYSSQDQVLFLEFEVSDYQVFENISQTLSKYFELKVAGTTVTDENKVRARMELSRR